MSNTICPLLGVSIHQQPFNLNTSTYLMRWCTSIVGIFLSAGPSLEKQGLKPFRRILRHQMTFFGGKNFPFSKSLFHVIQHTQIFPTVQEARQSEFVCKTYATQNLTFLFSPPWFKMMSCQPPLFMEKWIDMCL